MLKKSYFSWGILIPLGAALLYPPIWAISETFFFFLIGAYLLVASEIARRRTSE